MTQRPFAFSLTFLALFALVFTFMWAADMLPEPPAVAPSSAAAPQPQPVVSAAPQTPVRIVIKDIGLDAAVDNPNSTDVAVLDKALENGAVRYPTSALLGQEGTMLLFGHSSYLPVVYHQYYKIFNGIQNLKAGQVVRVYSETTEYRYAVTGVRLANADEDVVELPQSGKHLVLVTCNSFATKAARYVVTADFVGSYAR